MNFIAKNKKLLGIILTVSALCYVWQNIIVPMIVLFALGTSII